jgi:hypothetical protein
MDIKEFIVLAEMPELNTAPNKDCFDTSEKAQAHRIGKINDYSRVKEKRKKEDEYKPVTKINGYTYPSYYHGSDGPSPFLFLNKKHHEEREGKPNKPKNNEDEDLEEPGVGGIKVDGGDNKDKDCNKVDDGDDEAPGEQPKPFKESTSADAYEDQEETDFDGNKVDDGDHEDEDDSKVDDGDEEAAGEPPNPLKDEDEDQEEPGVDGDKAAAGDNEDENDSKVDGGDEEAPGEPPNPLNEDQEEPVVDSDKADYEDNEDADDSNADDSPRKPPMPFSERSKPQDTARLSAVSDLDTNDDEVEDDKDYGIDSKDEEDEDVGGIRHEDDVISEEHHESTQKTDKPKKFMRPSTMRGDMPELNTAPNKGCFDTSEKAQAHRIGKINDYSRVKENRKKEDEYKPVTRINKYYHGSDGPSPFLFLNKIWRNLMMSMATRQMLEITRMRMIAR